MHVIMVLFVLMTTIGFSMGVIIMLANKKRNRLFDKQKRETFEIPILTIIRIWIKKKRHLYLYVKGDFYETRKRSRKYT